MSYLFSDDFRFKTWRRLWIALAEAQRQLGLPITQAQINQMKRAAQHINYATAQRIEKKTRHDVMAHLQAFGRQCPKAKPIIHLGATSMFVVDNTDLIRIREALRLTRTKLAHLIGLLGTFATRYKALPTLGFTHFQPAQPTTVGKRAALWAQDFVLDLQEIETRLQRLRCRSVKGTTGTQASFLELFDGDHRKVLRLEALIAKKLGFDATYPVTGQTYPRKVDAQILAALAGIAQSAAKMTTDLRLLQALKEIEEPFAKHQVGSSAMAYKRNPIWSERIGALARFVIANQQNAAFTAATQWLERSLDDSGNRRLSIPEGFLATDGILNLARQVADGLVVNRAQIRKHLDQELPFMATENILMAAVKAGGDRQDLHERIRVHAQAAATAVKQKGKDNDLLQRLAKDHAFAQVHPLLKTMTDPRRFIGRAPQQVDAFVRQFITPIRRKYRTAIAALSKKRISV